MPLRFPDQAKSQWTRRQTTRKSRLCADCREISEPVKLTFDPPISKRHYREKKWPALRPAVDQDRKANHFSSFLYPTAIAIPSVFPAAFATSWTPVIQYHGLAPRGYLPPEQTCEGLAGIAIGPPHFPKCTVIVWLHKDRILISPKSRKLRHIAVERMI
jgi:hypothetical protein